jgi:chromosome segregation ATPase
MSGFASEEVASLQRQVKALSRELASARREHVEELRTKEESVFAGISKREKLQKLNVQLKAAKHELEVTAKAHAAAAEAAECENRQLTQEVKRLCRSVERSKRRIEELEAELATRPDVTLRMRVKSLCKKYHSDKCGTETAFTSDEVARDLIALLSDQYGVQ